MTEDLHPPITNNPHAVLLVTPEVGYEVIYPGGSGCAYLIRGGMLRYSGRRLVEFAPRAEWPPSNRASVEEYLIQGRLVARPLPLKPYIVCGGIKQPLVIPGQDAEVWTQANGQERWPQKLDQPPAMRPGFNQKK